MRYDWQSLGTISSKSYQCGFCSKDVAPSYAYYTHPNKVPRAYIYVCPHCSGPTFFDSEGRQTPGIRIGKEVSGISDAGVAALYNEARDCAAAGAHTAAVLVCRKILMNIAVHNGDIEGRKFIEYIEFLKDKGYIPPNGSVWVDKIRVSGNEATHEIRIMTAAESALILSFVEMLLRFVYEFPSLVKP